MLSAKYLQKVYTQEQAYSRLWIENNIVTNEFDPDLIYDLKDKFNSAWIALG